MSNQYDVQVLEEGHRNVSVRVTAVLDTSNLSLAPMLTLAQFTANDPTQMKLAGLRVDWLQYTVEPDIVVQLYWNSAQPQLIAAMSDSNDLRFRQAGGLRPNMTLSGYDGSINLSTGGYTAGNVSGFSVMISFVKLYQL